MMFFEEKISTEFQVKLQNTAAVTYLEENETEIRFCATYLELSK